MSTITAVAAAEPDPPRRPLTPAEPDWPNDTGTALSPSREAAILYTIAGLLGYRLPCELHGRVDRPDMPSDVVPAMSAFLVHEHGGQSALLLEMSDGTTWRLIAERVQR